MYNHLFGPVPSRRLGMSLGVDLVPFKVCSFDCIYCECGPTTKRTLERKEYILYRKVIEELTDYFNHSPDPDFITFSGLGEPTLNSRIGDILQFIKSIKPDQPVAVLTNGSMLSDKKVRDELMDADLILPSLDAATENAYKKLNRPEESLSLDDYMQGLFDFSNEFKGEIWLEVFILPGFNDSKTDLQALQEACSKIRYTRLQFNTLDRPGTVDHLRAATPDELDDIMSLFNDERAEIIAPFTSRKKQKSTRSDLNETILETLKRRPCTLEDLHAFTGAHRNEINKYLRILHQKGKIISKTGDRGTFYDYVYQNRK